MWELFGLLPKINSNLNVKPQFYAINEKLLFMKSMNFTEEINGVNKSIIHPCHVYVYSRFSFIKYFENRGNLT